MKKKTVLLSIVIPVLAVAAVLMIIFVIIIPLIDANRYIVEFSQSGEEYRMRCDNSVIDQIASILPYSEDGITGDCIEATAKQRVINLNITKLAGEINKELSSRPIFGFAHSYGELEDFSLESIVKSLARFIINYRIAVGENFPDKNRLIKDIVRKITREHKLRRGV